MDARTWLGADVSGRHVMQWELDGLTGAVVVVDVLRAFTTAAYAFGSGAAAIYLVSSVEAALAFKEQHPRALAMGEDHGYRPKGFDFSNSPVDVSKIDLDGITLVQRTTAGTQGVVAATHADRLWAASLVCASATARAVASAGLGAPSYVITGCNNSSDPVSGDDDRLTADVIERVRLGDDPRSAETVAALRTTREALRTLALGPEDSHPLDVEYAARVDSFDFAMEITRDEFGLRLDKGPVG